MVPTPVASRMDIDTMERARLSGRIMKEMKARGEPYKVQSSGSLNPAWIEWLMGFPIGHTALEPSEMPSYRKSSKKSAGQS